MHPKILLFLTIIFLCSDTWSDFLLGMRMADQDKETVRIVLECPKKTDIKKSIQGNSVRIEVQKKSPNFSIRNKTKAITSYTYNDPHTVRLHFAQKPSIKKDFWISPGKKYPYFRYVIDILLNHAPVKKAETPKPPPIKKKRILIDAGHGGRDPGTVGVGKVYEKTVTLKAAHLLAKKLRETERYIPILIRPKDQSMLIANRLKSAKKSAGDLFISLHADSCSDSSVRGLSLYTLSAIASDRQAARLALKENKADLIMGVKLESEIPEVANILIDLTKREKKNLSSKFARHLLNKLRYRIFLLRKPHRFANFYILKVPGLPSVLIELGYLSHKKEARLLQTTRHLDNICSGIIEAIDTYFKTEIHEARS